MLFLQIFKTFLVKGLPTFSIYFSESRIELFSSNTVHLHIHNGPTCSSTLTHGENVFATKEGWGYTYNVG